MTYNRKYKPQLDAFPAILGPSPRYSPLHPWLWWMSRNESQICFPSPPIGFAVVTWNLIFKRSSGFIHSVVTTPAPSPAAAWSYTVETTSMAEQGEIECRIYQSGSRKETSRLLYHASESWSTTGGYSAQKLQQAGLE